MTSMTTEKDCAASAAANDVRTTTTSGAWATPLFVQLWSSGAIAALAMVVADSLLLTRLSLAGVLCALASLASMTVGAILQKRITRAPAEVLPLQYGASLAACLLCLPFQPFVFERSLAFALPLLW